MVGYVILGLVAVFLAVILIRTAMFRPKKQPPVSREVVTYDGDKAVDALASLIRCKTVSYTDPALEDNTEFEKLLDLLPQLYPKVFEICEEIRLPGRALLLRWPGKHNDAPSVMMAHYDVVPVSEEHWDKPPFAGIIENDVLWGRGTLDTKGTLNGILSAADHLIRQDFQPENDLYFAFSGGEEINGPGADHIVQYFVDHQISLALVLDEGGAVVEKVFPGVKQPCGLIGIGEKGLLNAQFRTVSAGGHASAPKPHTPVGILARACTRVEGKPFKMHITKPAAEMFDTLGRHSTFLYRMIFANLWCFSWVLDVLGRTSGGEMNALLRTTVAFTQMEGNMRLNPDDSVASALAYLQQTVKDDSVEISALEHFEPSRISQTGCEAWDKVATTVLETWPGCIVSPYLMVQCSDSRHYGRISDKVYRFCAMALSSEERATIHGHNERIPLETIHKTVEFYIRLLQKC